jgi:hypothetical protein
MLSLVQACGASKIRDDLSLEPRQNTVIETVVSDTFTLSLYLKISSRSNQIDNGFFRAILHA